jgi:hypothetical protein
MVADRQGGERQDGMNPSELDFRFWQFETSADDVCRSAYGAIAVLSRTSREGRV